MFKIKKLKNKVRLKSLIQTSLSSREPTRKSTIIFVSRFPFKTSIFYPMVIFFNVQVILLYHNLNVSNLSNTLQCRKIGI